MPVKRSLDGRRRHTEYALMTWPEQTFFAARTMIIVDGYQSKDRSKRANGRDVTLWTVGKSLRVLQGPVRHGTAEIPPRDNTPAEQQRFGKTIKAEPNSHLRHRTISGLRKPSAGDFVLALHGAVETIKPPARQSANNARSAKDPRPDAVPGAW